MYDSPQCVRDRIGAAIANSGPQALPERTYFVAISKDDYAAQSHAPPACPFDLISGTCPYGDATNTGLSPSDPLPTFYQAFKAMHDYSEETLGGVNVRFNLKIRGGDFYYREPLLIKAESTSANWGGETWYGPHLFDEAGEPVKRNDDGDWLYTGDDGYSEADMMVANLAVTPFRDEVVTLDGRCAFDYADGDGRGEGEWSQNDYAMQMTCAEETSTLPGFADWFAGTFHTAWGMIHIHGGHRIAISGLNVVNAPGFGVKVQARSHTVGLNDLHVAETGSSGMYFAYGASDLWVARSVVERACALSSQENVTFAQGVSNAGFVNNTVIDGYNDASLDLKNDISDVYIYGNTFIGNAGSDIYLDGAHDGVHRVIVDSNSFTEGYYSRPFKIGSESGGDISQIRVLNNVSVNQVYGFWIGGAAEHSDGTWPVYSDIQLVNNTVHNAGNANIDDGVGLVGYGFRISYAGVDNVVVANNIFSENHLNQIRINDTDLWTDGAGSELLEDKLLLRDNIVWCADGTDEDGDGYLDCLSDADRYLAHDEIWQADPAFRDAAVGDVRLTRGSPAVEGSYRSPSIHRPGLDFLGRSRGFTASVGALER